MKIRHSFVSNSSSSSYIIKINKNTTCKHCGRSDPDIVEIVRAGDDYGDTRMEYENKEQVLSDIKHNIEMAEKDIAKYSECNPNDVHPSDKVRKITTIAKDYLEWSCNNLKREKERYDEINSIEGNIVGISIGYHDNTTSELFQEAKRLKIIEVIESEWD
jgi:hypothetical protein